MEIPNLEGYKTYLVGIATLAYALFGYFSGYQSIDEFMKLVLAALALMGLRHGISTGV